MGLEELYDLKIAALLHDPPHKPFVLERYEEEAKVLASKLFGNEISGLIRDDRIKIADRISSGLERWILRVLMDEKQIPRLFECSTFKIKNIIAPSLEKEISRGACDLTLTYEEYVDDLKNGLNALSERKLIYHMLYFLYEPLWILKGLPWNPADAQVPTQSVFDHDYATAAIVNWTFQSSGHVRGLLVGLDVPGVQEFIASSRKIRDAWISSYIVSALIWYAVIEVVDRLGPDVLLMPSSRMNIFYSYWLKDKLARTQGCEKLGKHVEEVEKLFYISDKVLEMFNKLDIPPYPILPGRATLVLPSGEQLRNLLGVEDLRKYFVERFGEGWKLLWKAAEKLAERRTQAGQEGRSDDLLWGFIKKVFRYYDNVLGSVGFDENPPLGLRVEHIEVDANSDDEDLWLLYDSKYRELVAKLSLAKYRRESPETRLGLYDATKRVFEGEPLGFPKPSNRGFDYCTSCGKLPAIVVLPAKEGENPEKNEYGLLLYSAVMRDEDPIVCNDALMNEFKSWLVQQNGEEQLRIFESIFSPGERLCPWCFLKRVLSLEPRLLKILLVGGDENTVDVVVEEIIKSGKRTWFPSTTHIASTRLYEKIADLEPRSLRKLLDEAKVTTRPTAAPAATWTWYFMDKFQEKIKDLSTSKDENDLYRMLVQLIQRSPEEEGLWFHPSKRSEWSKILGKFNLSRWCWRYYALIKADGDSIGDLLEGRLTAFLAGKVERNVYDKALSGECIEERERLAEFLCEYIENSCEGDFREFMKSCLPIVREEVEPDIADKEKLVQEIARKGMISADEARERVDRAIELLKKAIEVPRIVVSPSYHAAISAALMRIAMLDIAMISELDGVAIYSGGDDLMAFVPVDKALDAVYNTRRGFAGASANVGPGGKGGKYCLEDGFLRINNFYLPLLPNAGRSYSVYIAHYHYPLSVVVIRSSELLERAKKEFLLSCVDFSKKDPEVGKAEKDILIVAYNSRAAEEEHAVLPLTWKRPIVSEDSREDVSRISCPLTFVEKLLRLVDERLSGESQAKLSHSLLYDVKETYYTRTLATLIQEAEGDIVRADKDLELSKKLVQELVRRNARSRASAGSLSKMLLESFGNSMPFISLLKGEKKSDGMEAYPVFLSAIDVVRLIRNGMG